MDSFETNDMSFAAYLTMHGIKCVKAKRLGKTFKFIFADDSDEIEKLRYQYMSSESSRFDDAVRKLKKMVFGDK
jgi:hypothetical protein